MSVNDKRVGRDQERGQPPRRAPLETPDSVGLETAEEALLKAAHPGTGPLGLPDHPTAQPLREAALLQFQRQVGNRQATRLLLQRQPADGAPDGPAGTDGPAAGGPAAGSPAPTATGLIVEDSAADLTPGQMKKSDFVAQTQAAVQAAVDEVLAASPFGMIARPQAQQKIQEGLAGYQGQDGASLERTVRQQVPGTAGVTTARDYIPLVAAEAKRNAQESLAAATAGPEAPEGGGGGGLLAGAAAAVGNLFQGRDGLFFKRRTDETQGEADPEVIRAQLGAGQALDSEIRSGMEAAFGHDFSRVRVHTDGDAGKLAARLDARAFTIGEDIAFDSGEYQPGTPVGDALIAHELAHVVQQDSASAGPRQKGGAAEYNALEKDADRTAVDAVVSHWSGLKGAMRGVREEAVPRLKSGLRLSRCNGGSKQAAPTAVLPLDKKLQALIAAGTDYASVKAAIAAAPAAEKTTVLGDAALLRSLNGALGWNDSAKSVELLGRQAPEAATLLTNGTVQAALTSAWNDSKVTSPTLRHEEGGWIYMNVVTGDITVTRATAGATASINLSSPSTVAESIVVGYFHTHPNPTSEGWEPGPSPADLRNVGPRGTPAYVRSDSGDHTYGPGRRTHLAGPQTFPGAGGGDAPQARADRAADQE